VFKLNVCHAVQTKDPTVMEQPVQLIQTVLQRPVMMVCVVPVMMLLAVEYIVMELLALKAETVLQALVTKEFVLHV
jgi:hypothetical protein